MSAKHEAAVWRWVAKVNRAAREMDEAAASLHPSAWPEALAPQREAFRKLAARSLPPYKDER